jgi:hypothetical protein
LLGYSSGLLAKELLKIKNKCCASLGALHKVCSFEAAPGKNFPEIYLIITTKYEGKSTISVPQVLVSIPAIKCIPLV